jgi:adenylosuccinate synthase
VGKLQVVVGGQYGSEGKGAIAAFLASQEQYLLACRVGGPNAGHTVLGRCPPACPDLDGKHGGLGEFGRHPWRLRQIPVAAVANSQATLLIGPGSEIDAPVLLDEIEQLESAGYRVRGRLLIDGSATLITGRHKAIECTPRDPEGVLGGPGSLVHSIGSTGKGIGAARSDRVMRTALLARQEPRLHSWMMPDGLDRVILPHLQNEFTVQIEGTQGFALGQHAGHYPFCTSGDCTATDMLAAAGVPPWAVSRDRLEIWVVFRPHPIRVAGNSGPLRRETTWEDLGLSPEYTTVTRKLRRVGAWDRALAANALISNGWPSPCVRIALSMADHVVPALAGLTSLPDPLPDLGPVHLISESFGGRLDLLGTGPSTVIDLRNHHSGLPWQEKEATHRA